MGSNSLSQADEYDPVVIGSGVGGLATALAAVESGMSVAVLEKDKMIGGGTCLSHGGLWAGCNHIAKSQGIEDSRGAVVAEREKNKVRTGSAALIAHLS